MPVWLNIDLGELPDEPDELYAYAHVANIACGGHAGDEASMRRAVRLCLARGARVGAHPSFPDREGFGRKVVSIAPAAMRDSVREQCARLAAAAHEAGTGVGYVKAHGALYHAARDDRSLAEALLAGAAEALGDAVTIVGAPTGALAEAAASAGLAYAREGFADRATRPDGTLVPRDQPGALILQPAAAADRARQLVGSGTVDTVCVHGDTPGAVAIARAVRAILDGA